MRSYECLHDRAITNVSDGKSLDFKHSECEWYLYTMYAIREREYI